MFAVRLPGNAPTDTYLRVDKVLEAATRTGADAVDVWTWRQRYRGEVYRLLDPGMRDNPLWINVTELMQQNGLAGAIGSLYANPALRSSSDTIRRGLAGRRGEPASAISRSVHVTPIADQRRSAVRCGGGGVRGDVM